MKTGIGLITLGVDDLERAKTFYNDVFGWEPIRDEGIVMYDVQGQILSLYPTSLLATDAQVSPEGTGFRKFSLAILCENRLEVDVYFADLASKGASIVKPPHPVFWGGYSGYIADPDGNLWEIAHNPFLTIDAHGHIVP